MEISFSIQNDWNQHNLGNHDQINSEEFRRIPKNSEESRGDSEDIPGKFKRDPEEFQRILKNSEDSTKFEKYKNKLASSSNYNLKGNPSTVGLNVQIYPTPQRIIWILIDSDDFKPWSPRSNGFWMFFHGTWTYNAKEMFANHRELIASSMNINIFMVMLIIFDFIRTILAGMPSQRWNLSGTAIIHCYGWFNQIECVCAHQFN